MINFYICIWNDSPILCFQDIIFDAFYHTVISFCSFRCYIFNGNLFHLYTMIKTQNYTKLSFSIYRKKKFLILILFLFLYILIKVNIIEYPSINENELKSRNTRQYLWRDWIFELTTSTKHYWVLLLAAFRW